MTTIKDFEEKFTVTGNYIKDNFEYVGKCDSFQHKTAKCPQCKGAKKHLIKFPSESWTRVQLCRNCEHIVLTLYADNNGGHAHPDTYYIYRVL